MTRLASILILLAFTPTLALATTYVVKPDGTGDFPTIQKAMDAVVNGDIIELTDGTFTGGGNRDIDFLGKAVTVRSQSGEPDACVIDCENSGRGFYFHAGETPSSVLEGIGITRGFAEYGGGILCEGSSPSVSNCVFSGCQGYYAGGGICSLDYSSPYIIDCVFAENISNESIGFGGGMACAFDSNPTLIRCTFWGNQADTRGGAFSCGQHSSATLDNCTFYGNTCINGSNIGLRLNAHVLLLNCIVAFGVEGSGVWGELDSAATLLCSDVYGNEGGDWVGIIGDQSGLNGNISEDPLFCDAENADLTLAENSPCAHENSPCGQMGAWPVGCEPVAVEGIPDSLLGICLAPSRPNPFSGSTSIRYVVPGGAEGPAVLRIYDPVGRLVRTLVQGPRPVGVHTVTWDATNQAGAPVAGGVYFYQLNLNGETQTRRMVLVQ